VLRLLLGGDEENRPALPADALQHGARVPEGLERLLQIDDVDSVALDEDEFLHLRVPPTGLMPEVDARLEKLLHTDFSPESSGLFASAPSCRATPDGAGDRRAIRSVWNGGRVR